MFVPRLFLIGLCLYLPLEAVVAQNTAGIDPEALIERILAVEQTQREQLEDVTFDAEYVEREDKGEEGFVEKVRLVKKVYLKYVEDTVWYAEQYLDYYKEGELQGEEELQKEVKDRNEKKAKRKAQDISYPMLKPFLPEQRAVYELEYLGVADERIDDLVCHLFRVSAKEPADSLINGDYYFEAENFHLVRVDFSPSKLVSKLMFKLKEMDMSIRYEPTAEGFWLPRQFDVRGRGKAAFFIGVNFTGTEYYRNPQINTGLDDSIFEVADGN
jgi:hypothetical protein